MTKPASIRRLEQELGRQLTELTELPAQQKIIEWQAGLLAFYAGRDTDTAARREAALGRLKMSVAANTYLLDEQERLIGLNLYGNGLAEVPFDEPAWQHLQVLVLSGNQLQRVQLPALPRLEWLDLGDNSSLRSLRFEGPLPALETLDASDSGLEALELPAGFSNLKTLDASRNQLATAALAGDCPALEWLDLSGNQLAAFALPAGFARLAYLFLGKNEGLKELKFAKPLGNLNTLHLSGCALDKLPDDLLDFKALQSLYLHGNPLPSMQDVISGEASDNAKEAVFYYLNSQRKGNKLLPLWEAKLILVGNGKVGKTSISRKLRNHNAPLPTDEAEDRTPALEIQPLVLENLPPDISGQPETIDAFQLNIWDFGGQGRYREIQQLFCSRKSLYLFVTAGDDLPTKEDYVGFEYWLSMVSGFSYDESTQHSPVIYVVNKTDDGEKDVEEVTIKTMFPNIKKVVKISCRDMKRFGDLEDEICERLKDISPDIFTARFPENWLAVKKTLEDRKPENLMLKSEYLRICREDHEIKDEGEALKWLEILDRIGVVIYLDKNPRLSEKIILNPEWVKDAIVQVIDSGEDHYGIIRQKDFRNIWKNYAPDLEEDFIQLLLSYQLCFEQADERGQPEYVVPALLPAQAPPLPAYLTAPPALRFRFGFKPFIPAGTVNKLMVNIKNGQMTRPALGQEEGQGLHRNKSFAPATIEIFHPYFWKNNVILRDHDHQAYAHVWEDWNEHAVFVDLFGAAGDLKPMLQFLETSLRQLNSELKAARKIHHLDVDLDVFRNQKWKNLNDLEEEGIDVFGKRSKTTPTAKLKCFVSYAHADDSRYMRCFVDGIRKHSEWDIFDDRGIPLGADWHQTLLREVRQCDFGIYLLSQAFIKSDYIREHEFGAFVERQQQQGFPFFGVLLSECQFEPIQDIASRQFFNALGQDYGLADTHRDKQITFDRLARIYHGAIEPNPDREAFFKSFVAKANAVLKEIFP